MFLSKKVEKFYGNIKSSVVKMFILITLSHAVVDEPELEQAIYTKLRKWNNIINY